MLLRILWALIQSTIATLCLAVAKSFGTLLMNMVVWWLASLARVLRAKRSPSKEPKNVWKQPKSACKRLLRTWWVDTDFCQDGLYFCVFVLFPPGISVLKYNLSAFLLFVFPGSSSDHWVRDSSEVPPFYHGSQGLTDPADHQRSQCTD